MKDARKSKLLASVASNIQFIRYIQGWSIAGYGADFVAVNSDWALEPRDKDWMVSSSRTSTIYYFKKISMLKKILQYDSVQADDSMCRFWKVNRQY